MTLKPQSTGYEGRSGADLLDRAPAQGVSALRRCRTVWPRDVALASLLAASCIGNPAVETNEQLDREFYGCLVEPIVLGSCGFARCHGEPGRPYRLAHPFLMRYDNAGTPLGTAQSDVAHVGLREHETDLNYAATAAFAQRFGEYAEPLLLIKPLDRRAGGAFHGGQDLYGRADVFESRADPALQVLERWIAGETMEDPCVRSSL